MFGIGEPKRELCGRFTFFPKRSIAIYKKNCTFYKVLLYINAVAQLLKFYKRLKGAPENAKKK